MIENTSFSTGSTTSTSTNNKVKPNKDEMDKKLLAAGVPQETIEKGMDAVFEYAKTNGINIAPPEDGKPPEGSDSSIFAQQGERPQGPPPEGQPPKDGSDETDQALISAGIPMNIIAKGDTAIKQYAEENNLTLPDSYTESSDTSLDLSA